MKRRLRSLLVSTALLAAPGAVLADNAEDCEQEDIAALAVRACRALLGEGNLDPVMQGQIYTLRGTAWYKEEVPEEAVSDFTRALEIDGNNIRALKGRAKAHETLRHHDLAVEDLTRLIALEPDKGEHVRGRAAAHLSGGKTDAAIADYGKAIELDPKDLDAFIGRAHVYIRLEDREKALADFAEALKIDPKSVPAYMARAVARDHWGDNNLAVDDYLAALRNNGMNLKARQALQRLGVFTPPN